MAQLRDTRGRFMRSPVLEELEAAGVSAADLAEFMTYSLVVREAKIVKAREVRDYWQSIAPRWGDRDPKDAKPPTGLRAGGGGVGNDPGDYAPSIKVVERDDGVVEVGTKLMPLASILEYGSKHNPEYACAARTLAHFGGAPLESKEERTTPVLFVG